MGGTKIFVLQMKDLIRIGIFTVLGLALLILLLVLLVPRGRGAAPDDDEAVFSTQRFVPGTYASTFYLNDGPVEVRVTVSENDILMIYLAGMDDIQRVFYPLFEPRMVDLAQEVLRHQSAYIVPQTDYPVTTGILHEAILEALQMAYVEN